MNAEEALAERNGVPRENRDAFSKGIRSYLSERRARGKRVTRKEMLGFFDDTGTHNIHRQDDPRVMVGIENRVERQHRSFYFRVGMGLCSPCLGDAPIERAPEGSKELKRTALGSHPWREDECIKIQLMTTDGHGLFLKRCCASTALAGKKICAEVAAYHLCKLLQLVIVPPTRILRYKCCVYSAQDMVDLSLFSLGPEPHLVPWLQRQLKEDSGWADSMSDLWVFDYIGSMGDRHAQNLFFNHDMHTIKAIDHESGFTLVIPKVPRDTDLFLSGGRLPPSYSPLMKATLRSLSFTDCLTALSMFLPKDVIEGVWLRANVAFADMEAKEASGKVIIERDEAVTKAAVGDLADILGPSVSSLFQNSSCHTNFLDECRKSDDLSVKETADLALATINHISSGCRTRSF